MSLDYLHIGASRTGTTWLYKNFVIRHPQITTPNGKKHTAFWNQKTHSEFHRKRGSKNWKNALKPVSWYKNLFKDRGDDILLADITDGNNWLPLERIKEIKKHYPNVKITYAIRNPITTIWSHVVKHDKRVKPNAPLPAMKKALLDPQYVYNTHYMENIKKWKSVFGDQVLIFFYTEINDPVPLLKKLSEHLEVDTSFWDKFTRKELSTRVNVGTQRADIPPPILKFLAGYHHERIKQMEEYFNKDFSKWLRGEE